MNYKEKLTEEEIKDILEIFIVHHKMVNKVQCKSLGFISRKMFIKHKDKVNSIYEELDKK